MVEVADKTGAQPEVQSRRRVRMSAIPSGSLGVRRIRRPGTLPVLFLAALIALVLATIGIILSTENFTRGAPWQPRLVILLTARWISTLFALGVGLWWWRRAPANPTGRLLYLAAICDCIYLIANYWPFMPWAAELAWPVYLITPLLAVIVLGWPTGRPSRGVRRAVIAVTACVILINLVGGVFRKSSEATEEWPNWPHSFFSVPVVWELLDPIQAMVFTAIPAIAVIILLVRRRRAVPPAVRPLITPITVAGIVVAGSLVVLHFGYQVFGELIPNIDGDISTVRLLILLGVYVNLGIVAVGVLVGASRRQRAVAVGTRQMVVDLRFATPVVSPSAAAAGIVGDPSAVVRYRRADGRWIDSSGDLLEGVTADRRLLHVVDADGEVVAGLEVAAAALVPPLLADLAVSTIAARAANERAAALADTRRREVRRMSRDLVAAADAGRVGLERNLHDGAQQLLVGLALTAGLQARHQGPADVPATAAAELISAINQIRVDILDLIDSGTPAALSAGLAGALRSLAIVCPITASFDADGDLAAEDPLALGLYLAAGEALTNAVKHSGASVIVISLSVAAQQVRILLRDNGIGDLPAVPASLSSRVDGFLGAVQIQSPAGQGTTVTITAQRLIGGVR